MSSPHSQRVFLPALLLALIGALWRDSDGRATISSAVMAAMQLPALAWWLHGRCGWFGRRQVATPSRLTVGLTLVALAGCGVLGLLHGSSDVFFTGMTAFIAGCVLTEGGARAYEAIEARLSRPLALAVWLGRAWLAGGIVLTVLLTIPPATLSSVPDYRHNFWLHVVTCAQTAASALCLIGVTPYSLAEDFTTFGRAWIVLSTHLAGMGFAAMGLSILRPVLTRRLSLRGLLAAWTVLHGVGTITLYMALRGAQGGASTHGWQALVYATSALANSGLSMGPEGLAGELSKPLVYLTITMLCLAGSLGLPLLLELVGIGSRPVDPTSIDTQGPLAKTATWEAATAFAMLAVAAGLLFVFETPRFLNENWRPSRPVALSSRLLPLHEEEDHGQRWRMAVLISVTLRSAGLQCFNVSEGAISWPSYALLLAWMFVGGSAGGVAGGLRCTALALASILALHGRRAWEAVPGLTLARQRTLRRLIMFTVIWAACNALGVGAMSLLSGASLYDRAFESVAAMNGVGLSTGLSLHLTGWARLGMIGLMLLGRWGPILFWAWWSHGVSKSLPPGE